jgi:hypothetical protein
VILHVQAVLAMVAIIVIHVLIQNIIIPQFNHAPIHVIQANILGFSWEYNILIVIPVTHHA